MWRTALICFPVLFFVLVSLICAGWVWQADSSDPSSGVPCLLLVSSSGAALFNSCTGSCAGSYWLKLVVWLSDCFLSLVPASPATLISWIQTAQCIQGTTHCIFVQSELTMNWISTEKMPKLTHHSHPLYSFQHLCGQVQATVPYSAHRVLWVAIRGELPGHPHFCSHCVAPSLVCHTAQSRLHLVVGAEYRLACTR